MECSTCEDKGLVYCVREPEACESAEAQNHFAENPECLTECEKYWKVQEECSAPGLLEAMPDPKIDAEILRVCTDGRKRITAATSFPAFLRKALLPVTLFVIGFLSVGYIALNMENARRVNGAGMAAKITAPAVLPQTPTLQVATAKDSLKDSTHGQKGNYANHRGNLDGSGVIPVDLEKNK